MPVRFAISAFRRFSRRDVIHWSLAAPAAAVTAGASFGHGAARGNPAATPTASDGALIDAGSLAGRIDEPSLTVVALTPADDFAAGHVSGAAQVDWPALEVIDTSDASLEAWRGAMTTLLGTLGVGSTSSVVGYDGGTLFAARLWWLLRYLGHDNVRVLDGGLPAWAEAGEEVESGQPAPVPTDETPFRASPQPALLAQKQEVLASIGDPDVVFVDARSPDEYRKGHIPGAVNLNYPLNVEPDTPHTFKPVETLRQMYADIGATPDKHIIPYCSSGVRSAVTAFTLHVIGFEDVALYTGSWQEWGADPDTPKTTGPHP